MGDIEREEDQVKLQGDGGHNSSSPTITETDGLMGNDDVKDDKNLARPGSPGRSVPYLLLSENSY